MAWNVTRTSSLIALMVASTAVLVPPAASAQVHVQGSCWLHRGAMYGTMVHAHGDSLCSISFPATCYGGMMGPDSLLCIFRRVPRDSTPNTMGRYCPVALRCEIRDPNGQMMMSGHMTSMGLFQRPIELAVHYDPVAMAALGINLTDLVLTTWADGAYTIVADATHDLGSASFRMTTTRIAEWYGLADRTTLGQTPVKQNSWGQLKAKFR